MHNFHPKSVPILLLGSWGCLFENLSGGGALVQGNIKIKQIIAK